MTDQEREWLSQKVQAAEAEGMARESLNAMEGLPTLSEFEVGVRARMQAVRELVEMRYAGEVPANQT